MYSWLIDFIKYPQTLLTTACFSQCPTSTVELAFFNVTQVMVTVTTHSVGDSKTTGRVSGWLAWRSLAPISYHVFDWWHCISWQQQQLKKQRWDWVTEWLSESLTQMCVNTTVVFVGSCQQSPASAFHIALALSCGYELSLMRVISRRCVGQWALLDAGHCSPTETINTYITITHRLLLALSWTSKTTIDYYWCSTANSMPSRNAFKKYSQIQPTSWRPHLWHCIIWMQLLELGPLGVDSKFWGTTDLSV